MSPETSDSDAADAARLRAAIARFDAANAGDPNREPVDGIEQPRELVYARRMTEALDSFAPDASEVVRLAARCQHIRRWTVPRDTYPDGRDGYRRWRNDLARFHAETAGAILRDVGYDEDTVARVGALLRKERLKADPHVQLLEDVACLVFLQHYLPAFAPRQDEDKLVNILRKALRKMSARGQAAALQLDLEPSLRQLVARAASPLFTVGGSGPRPDIDLDRPRTIEADDDEARYGRRDS